MHSLEPAVRSVIWYPAHHERGVRFLQELFWGCFLVENSLPGLIVVINSFAILILQIFRRCMMVEVDNGFFYWV